MSDEIENSDRAEPVDLSSWTLLSDDETSGDDDDFGHRDIVEALYASILKAEPPFCIGLVGNWGVGKT